MQIINYKIKRNTIFFEVLTKGNNKFTHELPRDLSSQNITKYLKIIEHKIDNGENTENH
ncbi:hypothetical protein NGH49_12900 [Staphylococcus xylosus]|nr:hypothetical protein [Staphylococcus xylosus]MEB8101015.1 hypothetical protein [Staphylococcus xylosus]